jgi:hypothetical protein
VGEGGAPTIPGELFVSFGLGGFEGSSIVFSAWGLVHVWGLAADWSTLGRRVRVDILGHSAQRFTNQEVVKEETYS